MEDCKWCNGTGKQKEPLCKNGLHATDFNGKCFICNEQVFVKECSSGHHEFASVPMLGNWRWKCKLCGKIEFRLNDNG